MHDEAVRARRLENPGQTQAEIAQCLQEWIEEVNNGSAESIAALYAPNAILLATFEPKVLTNAADRQKYFTTFKIRRNLRAVVDESYTNALSADAGEASGLYTFSFTDDAGTPQLAKARFIFVFTRQPEGDWLIAAHHSSLVPA